MDTGRRPDQGGLGESCKVDICIDPATGKAVIRVPAGSPCPTGLIKRVIDAMVKEGTRFEAPFPKE